MHDNFQNYLMWSNQICSSTNDLSNYWHFDAGWKNGQQPPVYPAILGGDTNRLLKSG